MSLLITLRTTAARPSLMKACSSSGECVTVASTSPTRAIRNAAPLPTTTSFTRMPVCCSNAGVNLAAAPELTNEVVTATRSVDSAAGGHVRHERRGGGEREHQLPCSMDEGHGGTSHRQDGGWEGLAGSGRCHAPMHAILQRDLAEIRTG
jgi:hypothetical protein